MRLIQINPGDPHNDQVLAQTREDYTHHVEAIISVLQQGLENAAPMSAILALIQTALLDNETETRERLSALLALSIIKNIAEDRKYYSDGFTKYVSDLAAGR